MTGTPGPTAPPAPGSTTEEAQAAPRDRVPAAARASAPTLDKPAEAPAGQPWQDTLTRAWPLLLAVVTVLVSSVLLRDTGWPTTWTVDAAGPLDELSRWLILNRDSHPVFLYFLLHVSNGLNDGVATIADLFATLGWTGVTGAAVFGSWAAAGGGLGRRPLAAAGTALGTFAVIGWLGMWQPAMLTLALMTVAVGIAAALGLLLGLAAGLSDRADRVLRPVFDTMQVLPAFAYLLPFVLVFGIGTAPALLATVIYATPPMARLTALGLRQGDPAALEASRSLGASPLQQLRTARLPLARPRMLLGLNQTIMMALSMVVIASIIGAGGLGDRVFNALTTQNIGQALTAGTGIVLIAVWLDRTTSAVGDRLENPAAGRGPRYSRGVWAVVVGGAGTVAAWQTAWLLPERGSWPSGWTVSLAGPVNTVSDWVVANLGSGVPVVGGTLVWAENFTLWLLNPLRDALLAVPWWALLLLAAVLAFRAGRWPSAVTAVGALAAVGVLGLWDKSLNTLSQVLAALLVTLLLGVVIGLFAARHRWVERALRPVLDVLQTMPQFIYLIPVIALFGVGRIAAISAAVIYALPAVIRITTQGVRQVDPTVLEASRSLGAGALQQLRQVQLPLARSQLLLAVNQGVVLVLAVVVVGGLVGGGALGFDTVYGLQRGDLGTGLPAGVAIVCLGLLLDRITQPARGRSGAGPS